jgi:hypothetical protein
MSGRYWQVISTGAPVPPARLQTFARPSLVAGMNKTAAPTVLDGEGGGEAMSREGR